MFFLLEQKERKTQEQTIASALATRHRVCSLLTRGFMRLFLYITNLHSKQCGLKSTKRANRKLRGERRRGFAGNEGFRLVFVVSFSLFLSFGEAKERKMLHDKGVMLRR